MSSIRTVSLAAALSILGSISGVSAHGFVSGIVIGEQYYPGFNPGAAPFQHPPPPVIGWPNGASNTQFVTPQDYGNPNIVCHLDATPGEKHATVAAGSSIDLQWNQWDVSHRGPVIDYMARCDGECEKADKNALKFFKIDEAGLINGSPAPGTWASDTFRANNLTWTVTIPASIAPGNYVLRHELIALHGADKPNGAQNYPQCINLEVTGSGTENPAGIPATKFYTPTDPGISLSIYYPDLKNYTIPGPPLWDGVSSVPLSPKPGNSSVAHTGPSTSTAVSSLPESLYAAKPMAVTVMPLPQSSTAEVTVPSTSTDASPTPGSSVSPYIPMLEGSIPTVEATTPAVTAVQPSMMPTSQDLASSLVATEEKCSTTTMYTTVTMTTTVLPASTPTDVAPSPSDVALVPASSAEASSKASGTSPDSYPTGTATDMASASPIASKLGMLSSNVTSPTAPAASVVSSVASEIASVLNITTKTLPEASKTSAGSNPITTAAYIPSANPTSLESAMSSFNVTSYAVSVQSAMSTAAKPTASPAPGGQETELPGGMTLQEFIEWIKDFFAKYFGKKGNGRKHPRALAI